MVRKIVLLCRLGSALQQGNDEELMLQLNIIKLFAQTEVFLSLTHKQSVDGRYLFFELYVILAKLVNFRVHSCQFVLFFQATLQCALLVL